jgi:hypothetical protein
MFSPCLQIKAPAGCPLKLLREAISGFCELSFWQRLHVVGTAFMFVGAVEAFF